MLTAAASGKARSAWQPSTGGGGGEVVWQYARPTPCYALVAHSRAPQRSHVEGPQPPC